MDPDTGGRSASPPECRQRQPVRQRPRHRAAVQLAWGSEGAAATAAAAAARSTLTHRHRHSGTVQCQREGDAGAAAVRAGAGRSGAALLHVRAATGPQDRGRPGAPTIRAHAQRARARKKEREREREELVCVLCSFSSAESCTVRLLGGPVVPCASHRPGVQPVQLPTRAGGSAAEHSRLLLAPKPAHHRAARRRSDHSLAQPSRSCSLSHTHTALCLSALSLSHAAPFLPPVQVQLLRRLQLVPACRPKESQSADGYRSARR